MFRKDGDLWYFIDLDFRNFLCSHFDLHTGKLRTSHDFQSFPVIEFALLACLIPLTEDRNNGLVLDRERFNQEASEIERREHFDEKEIEDLDTWLLQHESNSRHRNKKVQNWGFRVMLLRNVVCHEKDTEWTSVREAYRRVVSVWHDRNFRAITNLRHGCLLSPQQQQSRVRAEAERARAQQQTNTVPHPTQQSNNLQIHHQRQVLALPVVQPPLPAGLYPPHYMGLQPPNATMYATQQDTNFIQHQQLQQLHGLLPPLIPTTTTTTSLYPVMGLQPPYGRGRGRGH